MSNRILFSLVIILFFVKTISIYFTNFNMFGDEAQYWLWSKNFELGYFSKPPLLSWVIGIYSAVFGDSFFSLKLIPVFAYLLIGLSVYSLSKNIGLKKYEALSCSLFFLLMPAVSFSSFIISTDIFLLLFWTLSLNQLLKITHKPKIKNFVFLGIYIGLAFISKYAAIYFLVCLLVYFLIDKKFRNLFFENYLNFLLSFIFILIILTPNIIWNFNNEWVTLQHTSDNANLKNIKINLLRGLEFLGIQILMLGPFIFLGSLIKIKNLEFNRNKKVLLVFSLPIFFIVFFEAVIVRANANWAAPALISFFVFLYVSSKKEGIYMNLNLFFNFIFCIIFFLLIATNNPSKIFERIIGLNNFAEYVYSEGSKNNITRYVVSDRLLFSSLNYELRERGVNFYMPYKENSKITNHFMISSPLNKLISENFILIGSPEDIIYLENTYKLKIKEMPKHSFTKNKLEMYEVEFD